MLSERVARWRSRAWWVPPLLLLTSIFPRWAMGEPPTAPTLGATLPELLEWVDRQNPELAAMRHEADAARERVHPAGALADPMFEVELRDISGSNPSLNPAQVGSTKYTFSQAFPWPGKRDLRRRGMEAEADAASQRARQTRAELRARVTTAFAQRYGVQRVAEQTQAILELLRDLERIARSRYAGGLAPQQDVVKAQLEQTALRGELIRLDAEAKQAQARLNGVLGRQADGALAVPVSLGPLPEGALEIRHIEARVLDANPQLASLGAQTSVAERGRELAREEWYPDFIVGVSPVQRGNNFDTWEASFAINIPLQRETRRSREREAASMVEAARSRRDAAQNQILRELGEAVAGYNAATEQERLLVSTQLPQAETAFSSALASYETGRVDFATLLDAQRQIRQARLEVVKAQVERRLRLADIERISGGE